MTAAVKSAPLPPAVFDAFAALLRARSGLVIGQDKVYLLETRLSPIVARLGLRDLAHLAEKLRAPGQEPLIAEVVEAMTTNESFFFRDDKPFTHLRTRALPALCAARPQGTTLRIWSAAASSGQEAYSIAMLLCEQRALLGTRKVQLIGTDIAREQLARARDGLYTQFEVQRGLPMTMLVKYFRKDPDGWRIKDDLRAMAEFKVWNLLSDLRSLGRFDVVFCRNVLIYFDAPTKGRVLNAIAAQMAPDAVLYLGGAETIFGITDRLTTMDGERGVYTPVTSQAARATG